MKGIKRTTSTSSEAAEKRSKHLQIKDDKYQVNLDATMLFRYKLAEVQKQLETRGII